MKNGPAETIPAMSMDLKMISKANFSKSFKNVLTHAPAMICIVRGPEHVFEIANEKYLQLVGYRDIVGKPVRKALPEVENQGFFDVLDKVYTTGEPFKGKELPIRLNNADKTELSYLNFVYQPTLDDEGKVDGIFVHAVDVTEQVVARKKIEESEHRYHELVHSAHSSLIATFKGEKHIIEIANDAMMEIWGKGKNVIGKPLLEVLPELIGQGLDKVLDNVYKTGIPYTAYEMPLELVRDGKKELHYFNFVYFPQKDTQGNVTGIVDIASEVTPQALVNKKIKESESHFRQMADLMPGKVSNSRADGVVTYVNRNWISYTGWSTEDFQERGWLPLLHPDDKKEFENRRLNALASGNYFEMEARFRNLNGEYKWHLCRSEAVKDENGKIKMWTAAVTEIQKIKEEEKRKEDFLKMVSHELKTPVTSIKGYVQLLLSMHKKNGGVNMDRMPLARSLERIDHQIGRLTRLISEMLDLTRIEDDKLELQLEKFCLNGLVTDTVQDINYTNPQHKIKVKNNCKCMVYADKDRIGQVLINFITNAIKYSPENQEIDVMVEEKEGNCVAVSVRDRGIGIAKKDQENIFKRFYRIGKKREETYSGFGIGLYLANDIVQRHNGSITVESEEGKGSTFTFTLAIAPE